MKKVYMEPAINVYKLQIESLMETISGADTETISSGSADSRQGKGFFDDGE